MPKKECCCVPAGSYIAIPCRYYSGRQFIGPKAEYAHYSGSPENEYGGGGAGQGTLLGPFRFVDGLSVFDSTRRVRYMLRGAGGGAGGPQIRRSFPGFQQITPFVYSKGGNGAYTEYETNASQDHVVRAGKGGSGGLNNWYIGDDITNFSDLPSHKRRGGQGVFVDGSGGDAAFISTTSGLLWSTLQPPLAAAGGGGGGAFFWNDDTAGSGSNPPDPIDTAQIGPRNGGNAGINQAEKGQDGWSNVSNGPTGGGGGASNTSPGSAGTRIIITSANIYPTDGTALLGGRGQRFRFEETNNVFTYIGRGGGGGGGLFGGGGGAFSGGGGGGSSTKGNSYSFIATNDYAANYCNPYIDKSTGIGGRRLPSNGSVNGGDGCVTQYYIKGFCPCDPSKNDIPEPLFICLNQIQYDYIISELGPPPITGFDEGEWEGLFVYNGEEYILLGQCETNCESVYKIEQDALFENIRWEFRELNPLGTVDSPPPCCSQIICQPVCRIEGANCANCGCPDVNEILSCCETEGKPDSYFGVYNGWIYSCTKSNQNWIVPGESAPNITTVCLSPSDQECNTEPQVCDVTVNDPYEGCLWCQGCQIPITVSGDVTYFKKCRSGPEPCERDNYRIDEVYLVNSGENFFLFRPLTCDVNYQIAINWSFQPSRFEVVPGLRITFDCVPQDVISTVNSITYGPNGISVCGATVRTGENGAYLSTIAERLNLLLAGRVSVDDLTGGKFYVGPSFCDYFEGADYQIVDGRLVVTIYVGHTYVKVCGFLSGNVSSLECSGIEYGGSFETYFESAGILDAWRLQTIQLKSCSCSVVAGEGTPNIITEYDCSFCDNGAGTPGVPCRNITVN